MPRVYVSLGSNIEPARHVRAALEALNQRFGEQLLSPVYESVAVGFEGDNFLNLVSAFDTDEDVHAVAAGLNDIETRLGRVRSGPRFSARTVDLDLLLYDDLVLEEPGLVLPRPEILHNAFVLRPLADIAPSLRHPTDGRSMAELWAAYDQSSQALWPVELNC